MSRAVRCIISTAATAASAAARSLSAAEIAASALAATDSSLFAPASLPPFTNLVLLSLVNSVYWSSNLPVLLLLIDDPQKIGSLVA